MLFMLAFTWYAKLKLVMNLIHSCGEVPIGTLTNQLLVCDMAKIVLPTFILLCYHLS